MVTRDWQGFERGEVVREVLTTVASAGALLTVALFAPGAGRVTARLIEEFREARERGKEDRYRKKIRAAIQRLESRRLVAVNKTKAGVRVEVTENGKRMAKRYALDRLEIPEPKEWDERWRIVGFDIPEKQRGARDALRALLKRLEFYPLQKSVWVYPFPCRTEIEAIRYAYWLERDLWYCETDTLDREVELREHFGLLLTPARTIT